MTLKPCPFCGKKARLDINNDHHGDYYDIGCSDEKCIAYWQMYTIDVLEMPIDEGTEAWNTRKG